MKRIQLSRVFVIFYLSVSAPTPAKADPPRRQPANERLITQQSLPMSKAPLWAVLRHTLITEDDARGNLQGIISKRGEKPRPKEGDIERVYFASGLQTTFHTLPAIKIHAGLFLLPSGPAERGGRGL
jgi:hypothetical protein